MWCFCFRILRYSCIIMLHVYYCSINRATSNFRSKINASIQLSGFTITLSFKCLLVLYFCFKVSMSDTKYWGSRHVTLLLFGPFETDGENLNVNTFDTVSIIMPNRTFNHSMFNEQCLKGIYKCSVENSFLGRNRSIESIQLQNYQNSDARASELIKRENYNTNL